MLEVIKTVAMLCSIHNGSTNTDYINLLQAKCQATLVECINKKTKEGSREQVSDCIIERAKKHD